MSIQVDELMRPVSKDNSIGENKEYDPIFLGLAELATGTPENRMGDSSVPGKEPDWRQLKKDCEALWEETRDLRVAVYLTIANFELDGIEGLSEGLSLIEYLIEEHWDVFYPQLDPEDDNDPTERINTFSLLSPAVGVFNDPIMFPNKVRMRELVPGIQYTLRDYLVITGELNLQDSNLNEQLFRAEMNAASPNILSKKLEVAEKIIGQLEHIQKKVDELTEPGSLAFETLQQEMKRLKKCYQEFQPAGLDETPGENEMEEVGDSASTGVPKIQTFNIATYMPSNRKEALTMLGKVSDYFNNTEPTSPVQLMLQRTIRMANMSFLDLLGEIDSSAKDRGRELFGIQNDNEDGGPESCLVVNGSEKGLLNFFQKNKKRGLQL